MEGLKQLIALQELDEEIRKLKLTRQQLVADGARVQHAVERAARDLNTGLSDTKSFRAAIDNREGNLKDVEAQINRLSIQLNTIKTNKEYAAIQHELLDAKEKQSRFEDEILAMMDELETRQKETVQLKETAAQAKEEAERRQHAIEEAVGDADTRIVRKTGERTALAQRIAPVFLQPYERLLRNKGGRALAPCRSFVCAGCRMSLTANTVNLLMSHDELIYCHSCRRILYIPEDEDPQGGVGAGRT